MKCSRQTAPALRALELERQRLAAHAVQLRVRYGRSVFPPGSQRVFPGLESSFSCWPFAGFATLREPERKRWNVRAYYPFRFPAKQLSSQRKLGAYGGSVSPPGSRWGFRRVVGKLVQLLALCGLCGFAGAMTKTLERPCLLFVSVSR